jgi:hypothetical protein
MVMVLLGTAAVTSSVQVPVPVYVAFNTLIVYPATIGIVIIANHGGGIIGLHLLQLLLQLCDLRIQRRDGLNRHTNIAELQFF